MFLDVIIEPNIFQISLLTKTFHIFFIDLGKSLFLKYSTVYFSKSNTGLDPRNCIILEILVFVNFILTDQLFGKASQSIKTCVSVNNKLCRRLVPSLKSPITLDQVTIVSFFLPDFNSLSCKSGNFTFRLLHFVILY